jgi:hypothetical protein
VHPYENLCLQAAQKALNGEARDIALRRHQTKTRNPFVWNFVFFVFDHLRLFRISDFVFRICNFVHAWRSLRLCARIKFSFLPSRRQDRQVETDYHRLPPGRGFRWGLLLFTEDRLLLTASCSLTSVLRFQMRRRSGLADNAVAVKIGSQPPAHGILSEPAPQHANGSYDKIEDHT